MEERSGGPLDTFRKGQKVWLDSRNLQPGQLVQDLKTAIWPFINIYPDRKKAQQPKGRIDQIA